MTPIQKTLRTARLVHIGLLLAVVVIFGCCLSSSAFPESNFTHYGLGNRLRLPE
jgi:hypothetical protein